MIKGDLEKSKEGIVKKLEEMMEKKLENIVGHMEEMMEKKMENTMGHLEDNIVERIVKLLQNKQDNIPKGDGGDQGAHDDINSSKVEKPYINRYSLRGLDSNVGSNQGWSARGIQLPKIDMRNFGGKGPLTWIFQME